MDILHGIEAKALALRESPPLGEVMSIADTAAGIELPMERPLYTPTVKPVIADIEPESGDVEVDAAALYDDLRDNRIRKNLRLEQETISFGYVESALSALT